MQSAVVAKLTIVFPLRNVGRRAAARRLPSHAASRQRQMMMMI